MMVSWAAVPAAASNAAAPHPGRPAETPLSAEPAGDIEATLGSYLTAISCSAPRACVAVGYHNMASGNTATLAESWDGHGWVTDPTPDLPGAILSYLTGVSCVGPDACMAVGYYQIVPGQSRSLSEWWNGLNWSRRTTAQSVSATSRYLTGISCGSRQSCMAVGYEYRSSGQASPLAETWNGRVWMVRPVSRPEDSPDSYLIGVSCVAADACAAVGAFTTSSYLDKPLAEDWNGVAWTVQATISPPNATVSALLAVSCTSGGGCAAVGYREGISGASRPLVELRRHGRWSTSTATPPTSVTSYLNSVACPLPNACTAVGFFHNAAGADETLAEQWNGTKWRAQATPHPQVKQDSYLNGVSCADSGDCSAAGSTGVLLKRERTLVELRTDSKWVIEWTPNP
jgi:hypothetical protein